MIKLCGEINPASNPYPNPEDVEVFCKFENMHKGKHSWDRESVQPRYGFIEQDIPGLFVLSQIDKPYGYIKTLAKTPLYCMKEIFMKKGWRSSLEYHVHKIESYHVKAGILSVEFCLEKEEYRAVRLVAGQTLNLPRGMMHRRVSVTDVVILEVSTQDENWDSHLVEEGGKVDGSVS